MAARERDHGDSIADDRYDDHSSELWSEELSDAERHLLTSAVRCFAAKGFHATTTRDISRGAGLSPAALYVHFSSKEHILYEVCRIAHERVLHDVTVDLGESPNDQLRDLVTPTWCCWPRVRSRPVRSSARLPRRATRVVSWVPSRRGTRP